MHSHESNNCVDCHWNISLKCCHLVNGRLSFKPTAAYTTMYLAIADGEREERKPHKQQYIFSHMICPPIALIKSRPSSSWQPWPWLQLGQRSADQFWRAISGWRSRPRLLNLGRVHKFTDAACLSGGNWKNSAGNGAHIPLPFTGHDLLFITFLLVDKRSYWLRPLGRRDAGLSRGCQWGPSVGPSEWCIDVQVLGCSLLLTGQTVPQDL